MINLANFIFESGVSLSLLALIYVIFLRKETFFQVNRLFLLFSVLFSVVLPFIKLRVYSAQTNMLAEVTVTPYRNMLEAVTIYGQDLSGAVVQSISSSKIIIFAYLAGLLFFLGRLFFRLIQILLLIKRNPVQKSDSYRFVLINKEFSPFSFLKYVFVNPEMRNNKDYEEVIAHELIHIKQGHSFDVLILEILTVFQWFNPFMWMLKRAIRETHEFLADNAVLNSGCSTAQYKKMLLEQVVGIQLDMTNNFNSSLVKKRLKMISKIRSSKLANVKYIFGVLSLLALIVVFACERQQSATVNIVDSNEEKVIMTMLNDTIKLHGDKENLQKAYGLLNKDGKFCLQIDSVGDYLLTDRKKMTSYSTKDVGQVFFIVEDMPEFPGGDLALRKYIAQNVHYPQAAQEHEAQGKVYVTFVVDKDGSVVNAKIARGVSPALDAEALRVVSSLPKWKPGYQRGIPVSVSYTVPINFSLK